ncbi:BaiN/RdsA family NAD(P)/FAD-dependent oxidoreductase [Sphingobacterium tabacisoli]|uniref:NAD(P)/FAD-dependent oxidoreductase n=1 Tax=Sphingobacterium tabacisoli TaxID=2044855 RepID=A0ABW5L449_9SPHI|nr:TIGR03862 family flavoprotein [Sphingobacterium tabacisoli]
MSRNPIVIIGAGPAGLMAAQQLAIQGYKVHVYEQNKAAARKFLVAGDGGFNLTHSEPIDAFVEKYNVAFVREIVRSFDNQATVTWLSKIGIPTYVGSSGKIFPERHIKPIQVLQAWLAYLKELEVSIFYQFQLVDFDVNNVYLRHKGEIVACRYEKLILGLGGASWKKTGSDASWASILEQKGINVTPLESANSGYNTQEDWSDIEGQALKNIQIRYKNYTKLGEIVFTSYGIEGSPLYYMNRFTRKDTFPFDLEIDLKPNMSVDSIVDRLSRVGSVVSLLKTQLKLSKTAIVLLKRLNKEVFIESRSLAMAIKRYPVHVTGLRPIEEVISTAGGVSFEELDENLALYKFPKVHCVGEMIDWEAPTGGYLLQGCFSTGAWVAKSISCSHDAS